MPVVAEESGTPSVLAALPVLRLKRGEDRRLRAGHLWVFSNEVDNDATPLTDFAVGAMARVLSDRDLFLGYAYVNPHALICARILSRSPVHPPDRSWLEHRLKVALGLRERIYTAPYYRVVFGESDGLPGLVLDRYGDVVVGQIATAGMEAWRGEIDYWVFGDGEIGLISGSVNGSAQTILPHGLQATVEIKLTATDRGWPVSISPPRAGQ
ncbi:MAG: hypothetical protein ABSF31_09980 [Steroidobacteraceae bacterium]